MTNEAYTLMETNRDRAIVRRSARYKKGGSKSKKCTLGHEYKTKKELDKMNGECITWKLAHFYTWEEFKEMPDDIKIEYINYLLDTYGVGLSTISREVFGCSQKNLSQFLTRENLMAKIRPRKSGGVMKSNAEWFKKMIDEERHPEPKGEVCDVYIPEPIMRGIEKVSESTNDELLVPGSVNVEEFTQPYQHVNAMEFSTEYISDHIDHDMLYSVEHMFRGKKLKVSFTITAV